jgi:LmbE family N-acetylglucosaminyl deacetylase
LTLLTQTARAVGRPVLAHTARWWRRTLLNQAVDATGLVNGRRLMVLAPHPDDETLGCGAVIARARAAGDEVVVVVVTDGRGSSPSTILGPPVLAQVRTAELRTACRILGVSDENVIQLDREDGTLSGCVPQLAGELAVLLAEQRPETVFVTCAQDTHPDHLALHQALRLALGRAAPGGAGRSSAPVVLAYPVWTWMNGPWFLEADRERRPRLRAWAMRQLGTSDWVAVRCGEHLRAKTAAIEAYASQTTNLTGEPSWSYLPAESVSLFQQPAEVFLRVPVGGRSL